MKKAIMTGMMAALVAGTALAQDDVVMVGDMGGRDTSEVLTTAEIALVSSHVWRGQVLNNDFVVQPQLTASQYGVSVNVWGNFDLGKNYLGTSGDFSELDISLAYTLPLNLNDVSFDLGVIGYHYPANADLTPPTTNPSLGVNKQSTTELFAAAHWLTFREYVIPSITLFADVDQADGVYILFDIVAPYQISDYLWAEGGASAGWGNTSYNDYYWGGMQDAKFNDFNFYGNISYEIMDDVTASLNLTVTVLNGGSISDSATMIYEDKDKFWGGVNIAYDF